MDRRKFLQAGATVGASSLFCLSAQAQVAQPDPEDRKYWVALAAQVAEPVLHALSQRQLKATLPVEAPYGNLEERRQFTYLEAFGRLLTGMAPWLESGTTDGEEGKLRGKFALLAREAMDAATDPASPDFMNFSEGTQPVVDAAFLSLAIVRAPHELWHKLDARVQKNLIAALQSSRKILADYSNWLLFSAMVEVALSVMGVWWDPMRVDYALRTLNTWYKGDGLYGDGPEFHFDYYNSYVMHPMLLNILDKVAPGSSAWHSLQPKMLARARRYAAIQERLIAPDGSFPAVGRSLCYRTGAFHLLAEVALRKALPEPIAPAQVRSALTAVMRRMMQAPGTFDGKGFLRIGFCGHQPEIAERYISTGSSYLCSAAWLPLGLLPTDPFWSAPGEPWSAKKAWSGAKIPADHAITNSV
jgi:hypothetical protein